MTSNAPTIPSPADNSEQVKAEQAQLMEQYKVYLQMLDSSNKQRMTTNQFFIAINSSFTALFGYLFDSGKISVLFLFVFTVVGYLISRVWYLLLTSYNTINHARWDVVYDMEENFLYKNKPFHSEWHDKLEINKDVDMPKGLPWLWLWQTRDASSKKKRPYYSISRIEGELPMLFGWLYFILGLFILISPIWPWVIKAHDWLSMFLEKIGFWDIIGCMDWKFVGISILVLIVLAIIADKVTK